MEPDPLDGVRAAIDRVVRSTDERCAAAIRTAREEHDQILAAALAEADSIVSAARVEASDIVTASHAEASGIVTGAHARAEIATEAAAALLADARSAFAAFATLDARARELVDQMQSRFPPSGLSDQITSQPEMAAHPLPTLSIEPDGLRGDRGPGPASDADQGDSDPADTDSFLDELASHLETLDRARSLGDRREVARVLGDLSDLGDRTAGSAAHHLAGLARQLGPDARPEQLDDLINRCYEVRRSFAR